MRTSRSRRHTPAGRISNDSPRKRWPPTNARHHRAGHRCGAPSPGEPPSPALLPRVPRGRAPRHRIRARAEAMMTETDKKSGGTSGRRRLTTAAALISLGTNALTGVGFVGAAPAALADGPAPCPSGGTVTGVVGAVVTCKAAYNGSGGARTWTAPVSADGSSVSVLVDAVGANGGDAADSPVGQNTTNHGGEGGVPGDVRAPHSSAPRLRLLIREDAMPCGPEDLGGPGDSNGQVGRSEEHDGGTEAAEQGLLDGLQGVSAEPPTGLLSGDVVTLPPVSAAASGMPWPSAMRWCLLPERARPTRDGAAWGPGVRGRPHHADRRGAGGRGPGESGGDGRSTRGFGLRLVGGR